MIKRLVVNKYRAVLTTLFLYYLFSVYEQTKTPKRRQWRKKTVWTTEVHTNKQTNKHKKENMWEFEAFN